MIAQHVAHRRLILEGEPVPEEGDALQKYLPARFRGLGAEQIGGLFVHQLAARNERCRERRRDDAGEGDEEIERCRHVRHGRHRVVVVEDEVDEARQPHAHEVGARAADARRDRREQQIFEDDAEARVAERAETGDLRAFLLHEAGHVGEHDERRHEDEGDHEHGADRRHLDGIGVEGIDGEIIVEGDEFDVFAQKL